MNVKRIFKTPDQPLFADVALLVIRLVVGSAFMVHGWSKIQNPFGWMGEDAFAPGIFQALAAVSEFIGGAAWILGLVTPLASLGILCTMAVASSYHLFMRGDPFVSTTGEASAELALAYLGVALVLMAVGPGRVSVDRALFGTRGDAPGTEEGGQSS